MQKRIFNKLVDERFERIANLDREVKRDDLLYRYKGDTSDLKYNKFYSGVNIINKIRDGKEDLTNVKNNQYYFKRLLADVKIGSKKSKEQIETIQNIQKLYEVRNEAIKFYDDYSSMMSEAKYKAKNNTSGKRLQILTPKQMLQRLPIALPQVKAVITTKFIK